MNHTDDQLKQLLAKMLPETVELFDSRLLWRFNFNEDQTCAEVLDTELLALCSLVEAGLTDDQRETVVVRIVKQMPAFPKCNPFNEAKFTTFATWQQRTRALAEVKGVTL